MGWRGPTSSSEVLPRWGGGAIWGGTINPDPNGGITVIDGANWTPLTTSYYERAIALSPTSHWRLGDGGASFADSRPAAVTGTIVGGVTFGPSSQHDSNGSAVFDGSTGYATFTDVYDAAGTGNFAVACWIKVTEYPVAPTADRIVSKLATTGTTNGWELTLDSTGHVRFHRVVAGVTYVAVSTSVVPLDTWTHVIGMHWNGGWNYITVNGVQEHVSPDSSTLPGNASLLTVGRAAHAAGNYFHGSIDELSIWGTSLVTTAQAVPLYSTPSFDAYTGNTNDPIAFRIAIAGADKTATFNTASWSLGRQEWFSTLSPSSATFNFIGIPGVSPGDTVVVSDYNKVLWTGRIDTISTDTDLTGHVTTTIGCSDLLGRLGQAQLKNVDIAAGTLAEQVVAVCASAGLSVVCNVLATAGTLPVLDATIDYTGTVLDYLTIAEQSSNALLFMRPDGDFYCMMRDALPDYGDKAIAGLTAPIAVPTPTSHWKLNEASGNVADSMPAAKTGTAIGTPTYHIAGPFGVADAISLDPGDWFVFGDVYDFAAGASFTIAGWVKWDGLPSNGLLLKIDGADSNGWWIELPVTGSVRFRYGTNVVNADVESEPNVVPSDGSWCHLAVVGTATTLELFVNGVSVASASHSISLPGNTGYVTMGGFGTSTVGMAQWSIWSGIALTREQIAALMSDATTPLLSNISPSTWREQLSETSVINEWTFTKPDGTVVEDDMHAASILAHGLRSYSVSDYRASTGAHFSASLRTTLEEPRAVLAEASFPVEGTLNKAYLFQPMDLVDREGTIWQIMEVRHDIDLYEWRVSISADQTASALVGIQVSPAPTPDPEPDPGTDTVTLVYDCDRDSVVARVSNGDYAGNGEGDNLMVGYWQGFRYRSLIHFPISWPSGYIRVKRATLRLRTSGQSAVAFGSSPQIYVRRLKSTWSEGNYGSGGNQVSTTNAVVWPGPDANTTSQTVKSVTQSEAANVDIDVTDIAEGWKSNGNYGLQLRSTNEDSSSRTTEFKSREGGTDARLTLVIEVTA